MKILPVLLPVILLLACRQDKEPADKVAPVAQPTPKELYEARCSACHQLYPLGSRTPVQWDAALEAMKDRAQLNPAQTESVRTWLHQNAQR